MIQTNEISKLGFGLMRLPENEKGIDVAQLCAMVDEYMKAGFHYFDTAYMYCNGTSENAIKEALVDRYPREAYQLTTKLPVWMMKNMDDRDRIFNDQLNKTGVDYFDFYLLHSIENENIEQYEAYDCFNWAINKKKEGKIKHLGFSFHGTPELLDEILSKHREVEFVQIQLNYVDWDAPNVQSGRCYEILRKYDLPIIIMEPVKGGTLAMMDEKTASMMKKVHPTQSIASWALRFAASLPNVITVLSGMSNTAQMMDNIQTFKDFKAMTKDEYEIIRQVREEMSKIEKIACTGCRYCVDGCPSSIAIPDIFDIVNRANLAPKDTRLEKEYDELIQNSGKASDCIQCGQCESVCPQHLSIISYLEKASHKFDS